MRCGLDGWMMQGWAAPVGETQRTGKRGRQLPGSVQSTAPLEMLRGAEGEALGGDTLHGRSERKKPSVIHLERYLGRMRKKVGSDGRT
jgi:hypothetical protein